LLSRKEKILALIILIVPLFLQCIRLNVKPKRVKKKVVKPHLAGDSSPVTYPHMEGYRDDPLHGKRFFDRKEICKSCHGDDLLGGISKVSCKKCHPAYPHSEKDKVCGVRKEESCKHGSMYWNDRTSCSKCHQINREDKDTYTMELVKKSCQDCHAYPHKEDWLLADIHGVAYFREMAKDLPKKNKNYQLKVTCLDCHDSLGKVRQRNKKVDIPECAECHADGIPKTFTRGLTPDGRFAISDIFPHDDDDFINNPWHGQIYLYKNEFCTGCHGADLKGGVAKKACNKCHIAFPHDDDFGDCKVDVPACLHGQTFFKNRENCLECHDISDKLAIKSSDSASIKAGLDAGKGLNLAAGKKSSKGTSSKDTKEIEKIEACNSCHEFPHDPNDWLLREGHGKTFISAMEAVDSGSGGKFGDYCLKCHKKDSPFRKRNKDVALSECAECHDIDVPLQVFARRGSSGKDDVIMAYVYPHSKEFKEKSLHGILYRRKNTSCSSCHGANLDGGTAEVACNKCHENFPHTYSFENCQKGSILPCEHGSRFFANRQNCRKCHKQGVRYEKNGNVVNDFCLQCHESYPHDVNNWGKATEHGRSFIEIENVSDCFDCHAKDAEFRTRHAKVKIPDCKECHFSKVPLQKYKEDKDGKIVRVDSRKIVYPHSESFTLNRYHGFEYMQDKEKCNQCHGNDLKGGISGKSCTSCHNNYPHDNLVDWRKGEGHGERFVEEWNFLNLGKGNGNGDGNGINDNDLLACMDCHDKKSSFFNRYTDKKVPTCKKCHQIDIPHYADYLLDENDDHHKDESTNYKHHSKEAQNNFDQCKLCHLDKNKGEPYVFKNYTKLTPREFYFPSLKVCNDCHKGYNKSITSLNKLSEKVPQVTKKYAECTECHGDDRVGYWQEEGSGDGQVKGCIVCHNRKASYEPYQKNDEVRWRKIY